MMKLRTFQVPAAASLSVIGMTSCDKVADELMEAAGVYDFSSTVATN